MVDRRTFVAITGGVLLGVAPDLWAQGRATMRRIGVLSPFARAEVEALLGELKPELEKLGWTEGRNIEFLEAADDGRKERSLADLGRRTRRPASRSHPRPERSGYSRAHAGDEIDTDRDDRRGEPLEVGIIADYSRPGGNVTGASYLADESIVKLVQFLKKAAPRLRSVAMFSNPSNAAAAPMLEKL